MEFREPDPVIVPEGEGQVVTVLGGEVTFKLVSDDTGDALAMFEIRLAGKGSTPLHVHHREDESLYVVEGEFEIQCGDRHFKAPVGMLVFLPRDIPHAFRNLGDKPARLVSLSTPAGIETFYQDVAQLPPEVQADASRMTKVAKKHGIEIQGAPQWKKG